MSGYIYKCIVVLVPAAPDDVGIALETTPPAPPLFRKGPPPEDPPPPAPATLLITAIDVISWTSLDLVGAPDVLGGNACSESPRDTGAPP